MFTEKVEKMKVPDDDMLGWIHALQETGFSEVEIDTIMTHLNDVWATQKLQRYIDEEIELMKKDLPRISGGKTMTPSQEKELRSFVLERLRKISNKELERGIRYKPEQ